MDVYVSPGFESIHSLRKRVGDSRLREEHPYKTVIDRLPSLSCSTRRQPLRSRNGHVRKLRLWSRVWE